MSGSKEKIWECQICGFVYDPKKGVPAQEIKRGASFPKLPQTFACPGCGSGKELFEVVDEPLENGGY